MLDAESNTDWKRNGSTWYKAGGLVGLMISNRVGVWVKAEIPFGQYRLFNWVMKGSVFITRY
jgi:hypothetical protein